MRYFFYTDSVSTVIIVDEKAGNVMFYPERGYRYSSDKQCWMDYYSRRKEEGGNNKQPMFEICENQFKKFKELSITPQNWDW